MTTNILWTAEDVIQAVCGKSTADRNWQALNVSIDSRTLRPGDLFIAINGPSHDGHDHVADAFEAGAVAAIVSRKPEDLPSELPLVIVEDTYEALQAMGRSGRSRSRAKIIAVTGSVGKTSTKEMLRKSLEAAGKTYANAQSYNNCWGVPLSLACMPEDTEYGVFELGMNHAGELGELSRLVKPDVAIITNVDAVHLEFFPSTVAIADAKAEIFEGMTQDGVVVLNRTNKFYARLYKAARRRRIKRVLSFGLEGKADMRVIDCALTTEGSAVNAMLLGYNIHYSVGSPGIHLVENSLAALLASTIASGKKDECAKSLSRYRQLPGRGVKTSLPLSGGGTFTLIDESYNASPLSVRAAISVLSRIVPVSGGRRILVLGDMRELGAGSAQMHLELVKDIEHASIDSVFCCGDMMQYLYGALPASLRGGYAHDSEALAPLVLQEIGPNDTVSVKGSKAMNLEAVINSLKSYDVSRSQQIAS